MVGKDYFRTKLKIMRYFLFFTLFFLIFKNGFAQENKEHFRGGMMLHTGYISNSSGPTKIDGLCSGIGGKIVFPVTKHFRIGCEGYVSNYTYPDNDGFYKLGWGGALVEYQLPYKRFIPVIGITVGGGRVRDSFPLSGNYTDNEPDNIIYKDYSKMIIAPQISLEYSLTSHINIAAKIDYLLYPGIDYLTYIPKGPRFYAGFLFSR